jgi:hypothetical protein
MGLRQEIQAIYQFIPKSARRAARAAGVGGDWSPAATFNIFQITGGPVEVTNMFGHVVALFTGAATILPSFIPAGGVANAFGVVSVAAAYALNTLLVWDGSLTAVSGVVRATPALGHGQSQDSVGTAATSHGWKNSITFIPGIICIVNGVADATGQVDWYINYRPLTPNAQLVAIP